MRVVAIIQARMGSSRFPGKVLQPLAGKPLLWHIIHRLRKCRRLDQIAITTSTNAGDDALCVFAREEGIPVVRGPEENVLERYALTARELSADVIVRITGDVPLVDPEMVDHMVQTLVEGKAGFCTVAEGVPCIHEGIDPFTREALDKLIEHAGEDLVAREHVVAYFKQHSDFVPIAYADVLPACQYRGARLSVDTPSDLKFIEALYAECGAVPGEISVGEVVFLLRQKPELLTINANVRQKAIGEASRHVVIRCDGGRRVGLGHVVRCLALADELRERHGLGITFAVAEDEIGGQKIRESGYAVRVMDDGAAQDEAAWLKSVLDATSAACLIMDFRTDLERRHVEDWRKSGILIVTIDDPSDRRLAADLAFYPPVPQVKRMDWTGFTGKLYSGWEWVILRHQFEVARSRKLEHENNTQGSVLSPPPCILVTMGGSDPWGLTPKVVCALLSLDRAISLVVVVGKAYAHIPELRELLVKGGQSYELREDVQDMAELMRSCDLAVATFSMLAYELVACGVPALYLCPTSDHAYSAEGFVESGLGVSLGFAAAVQDEQLAVGVQALLSRGSLPGIADGEIGTRIRKGRRRVAEEIAACIGGGV